MMSVMTCKPFTAPRQLPHLHIVDPDLCVVPLGLQLQLNVQQGNLWVIVVLGLHLKAGVGKGLLERHTINQPRLLP